MKHYYKFALLLVITLLMGFKAAAADEITFEKGNFNEILKKAKDQNKIVMIDFVTDWCIWCKHLDMRVYNNQEVVDYATKHQINWKTDAEKDGKDLAKKYGVSGYPTLVFVDGDGNEIDKIVGFYPAPDFLENIKKINERKSTLSYLQTQYANNKTDIKTNLDLATKLVEQDKGADAKQYLNFIISKDPSNAVGYTDDAALTLAMISAKDKKPEAYITEVSALLDKYPTTNMQKDANVFLADKYMEANNEEKAFELYTGLVQKYPKDDMVNFYMGQYYLGKARKTNGDTTATSEQLAEAVKNVDMSIPYFTGGIFEASADNIKADLLYKMGDMDNAKLAIDRTIQLWPDNKTYNKTKTKVYGSN